MPCFSSSTCAFRASTAFLSVLSVFSCILEHLTSESLRPSKFLAMLLAMMFEEALLGLWLRLLICSRRNFWNSES